MCGRRKNEIWLRKENQHLNVSVAAAAAITDLQVSYRNGTTNIVEAMTCTHSLNYTDVLYSIITCKIDIAKSFSRAHTQTQMSSNNRSETETSVFLPFDFVTVTLTFLLRKPKYFHFVHRWFGVVEEKTKMNSNCFFMKIKWVFFYYIKID